MLRRKEETMNTHTCIATLERVEKRYGSLCALDGLDLEVRRGEVLALLGPNGAGKSTTISLLLGLQRPDVGAAALFGHDPQSLEGRQRIGVMLQSANLPPTLKVRELLRLTASYYPGAYTVAECARRAGVGDLLERRYSALSGGQQRSVQFAMAIVGRPELLFLDEPTVGLDLSARQALWAAVHALVAEGCAVVLTTHYLEEAEALADRVYVLGRGRVVSSGTVDELRARVSVRTVRCRTRLSPDHLRTWTDVVSIDSDGVHLSIGTHAAERVVHRLLQEDPTLADLEVRRAGLAEAFSEITQDITPATAGKEAA
jgi:ABC-2 type transport system ATP-binding protein